jgi:hypothetical protein
VDGLSEGSAFASLFGRLAAAGTPTKDKIECAFSKKKASDALFVQTSAQKNGAVESLAEILQQGNFIKFL